MLAGSESFSTFSTSDLDEAKKFYGDILGLKISENKMGLLELHFKNNSVLIYPKPDHQPAAFTVLNFKVREIEKQVDELNKKGIQFEKYDIGHIKTNSKGIHTSKAGPSVAWFKDPAGNILSIIEEK